MDAQDRPEIDVMDPVTCGHQANNLPLDILHYFFTLIHPFYLNGEPTNDVADKFATQVSHVCRNWRNVALHTPRLWTNLVFEPEDAVWGFQRQQLWIERSRDLPLGIYIDGDPVEVGDPWKGNSASIMGEIRSVLEPVARRWKWLMLSEIPIDAVKVLFENLGVSAPSLVHIYVQRTAALSSPAGWTFRAFDAVPQLVEVEIGDIPVDLSLSMFHSSGVRAVCFSDLSFSPDINVATTELMNLMKGLVSLEILELEQGQNWVEVNPDEGSQSTIESFLLPNLHSIINLHRKLAKRLLPLVETPNLHTLTDISFDAYSIICDSTSPPDLRRLGIVNKIPSEFDDEALLSGLFECFPNLTHLELMAFDFITHDSWRLLSNRLRGLVSLRLSMCLGVTEGRVRDLIGSRIGAEKEGTTRLTELFIAGRGVAVVEGMKNWGVWLAPLVESVHIIVP